MQVEPRQGEKPYAYEVKDHKLQLLPVPRAPNHPIFLGECANQTCSQHGPASQPHHSEPISGGTPPPQHSYDPSLPRRKPRAAQNPDRWQTAAAMLAPCQPACCCLLTASQSHSLTLFIGCQASLPQLHKRLWPPHTVLRKLAQPLCPAPAPPPADQLVSWRRLQAGQWTRPPGGGPHLCCRQTPPPQGQRRQAAR